MRVCRDFEVGRNCFADHSPGMTVASHDTGIRFFWSLPPAHQLFKFCRVDNTTKWHGPFISNTCKKYVYGTANSWANIRQAIRGMDEVIESSDP